MYAVVFSSTLKDSVGYDEAADRMAELCERQPGFVEIDAVRSETGAGITVCLWESLESIKAWRDNIEHRATQEIGIQRWYSSYRLLICEILADRSM